MTLIIGQEAESTGASFGVSTVAPIAFAFVAAVSGEVTALHVTFSVSGTGTGARIALVEKGEAGKPNTATGVLAEGEVPTQAAGAHEVAVAGVKIKAGVEYFLIVLGVGGTCKLKGSTEKQSWKSATSHAKISEYLETQWSTEGKLSPVSVWATGTEEGAHKTVEEPSTVKEGSRLSSTGVVVRTGSSSIAEGSRLSGAGLAVAQGSSTVKEGSRLSSTASVIVLGSSIVREGSRFNSTGGNKLVEGSSVTTGGGRLTGSGIKIATSSSTVKEGSRLTSAGRVVVIGSSVIKEGSRFSSGGRIIVLGASAVKEGSRFSSTAESAVITVITSIFSVVKGPTHMNIVVRVPQPIPLVLKRGI